MNTPEFTCPHCDSPLYLTQSSYSPEEIKENELNIKASLYVECHKNECSKYYAEYGTLRNGNIIHIDGEKPLATIKNSYRKELSEMNRYEKLITHIKDHPHLGDYTFYTEEGLEGDLFTFKHYLRILTEEGIQLELETNDVIHKVFAVILAVQQASFPIYYIGVLARIMKDSGSEEALEHFAKTILAMDGKL